MGQVQGSQRTDVWPDMFMYSPRSSAIGASSLPFCGLSLRQDAMYTSFVLRIRCDSIPNLA